MIRVWFALGLTCAVWPAVAQSPQTAAATPAPAPAPAVPDTDIFVADLDLAAGKVGAPRNVTSRPGYDNQPAFLPDGRALLYVVRDDSGSTDVWRVDLEARARKQVTKTPEAEYSPTPLADGSGFSAVRVEAPHAEGETFTESQRLFRYGFDGKARGPLLADVRRVGYHAWIDASHVALFIVGNDSMKVANALVLASLPKGEIKLLAKNIGRSLGRAPDGRVVFVDQSVADSWNVVAMVPEVTEPVVLVPVPKTADEKPADRSQDFCWLPDGTLMMSNGKRLLRWDGRPGSGWTTLAEFADLPGSIRRLAASRDGKQVAFVVDMPQ
jgi:hypothetical protein